MNFLVIYFKNGGKIYYNISVIEEFRVASDGDIEILFKDGKPIIYDAKDENGQNKWELI